MWNIDDLKWKEYLANNTICYYIQYYKSRGYGIMEFTMGFLHANALHYYYRLKTEYKSSYHCHQIACTRRPTFAMIPTSKILDHVINKTYDKSTNQLEKSHWALLGVGTIPQYGNECCGRHTLEDKWWLHQNVGWRFTSWVFSSTIANHHCMNTTLGEKMKWLRIGKIQHY